jgi:predicted ATPase
MWIEKVTLENIKCFEHITLRFGTEKAPYPWVTLLGENGGGKSTILQALGLLLAGPEGALQLTGNRRLEGWLKYESKPGKISTSIQKHSVDPGAFGEERKREKFGYTLFVTGRTALKIRNKQYTEPGIVENTDKILTWLRRNAFISKGEGWFACGYGPFRRLSRSHGRRVVPTLLTPDRYSNFQTQFDEDEPVSSFEQWMVILDYQIAKNGDSGKRAMRHRDMGVAAINQLLPENSFFDRVDEFGSLWFNVAGNLVPMQNLSDGFRSVLALAGDLIWRLLEAFPNSEDPLKEPGVVLLDELDIHLHPIWQREIPSILREVFPNLQFIVATHSPLIAAGAGPDALTYRIRQENGEVSAMEVDNLAFRSVDHILQSKAFGLVSPYSPQAEATMRDYLRLKSKVRPTKEEQKKLAELNPIAKQMLGDQLSLFGEEESNLKDEITEYIKKSLAR